MANATYKIYQNKKNKKYKAILKAKVHWRVVEDNTEALEISCINKYLPCTKHLNNRLHNFWSYVDTTRDININPINNKYNPYDMLTKKLNVELLTKFQNIIVVW